RRGFLTRADNNSCTVRRSDMGIITLEKPKRRKEPINLRYTFRQMRKQWSAYLFLSPWFIIFLIFTLFSVGFSFYLSFREWNILEPAKPFVGLDNYIRLFQDKQFYQS